MSPKYSHTASISKQAPACWFNWSRLPLVNS
uniref:Uncharacterized protein n=1 Tax=Anguilla anguilla TaxID=7936 RepID=A0A0E9UZG9_ANGAN